MYSGGQNRDDSEGYVASLGRIPGVGLDERLGSTYSKARIALCRIYSDTCSAYSIRGGGSYA